MAASEGLSRVNPSPLAGSSRVAKANKVSRRGAHFAKHTRENGEQPFRSIPFRSVPFFSRYLATLDVKRNEEGAREGTTTWLIGATDERAVGQRLPLDVDFRSREGCVNRSPSSPLLSSSSVCRCLPPRASPPFRHPSPLPLLPPVPLSRRVARSSAALPIGADTPRGVEADFSLRNDSVILGCVRRSVRRASSLLQSSYMLIEAACVHVHGSVPRCSVVPFYSLASELRVSSVISAARRSLFIGSLSR